MIIILTLKKRIVKQDIYRRRRRKAIWAFFVLAIVFIKLFAVDVVVVQGTSMEPTLREGQFLVLLKSAYWIDEPQNGDIVVVQHGTEKYIKRIVACPGEIPPGEDEILQEGRYYIMGDNMDVSVDSRSFGAISKDLILGCIII